MKNMRNKKALAVFLSVLMILSCWVWVAPTDAAAADSYYVRVYLNIYDGANSDGYENPYTVVTDKNSEFYGKPDDYKWDYGSSWNAFDNSEGYDGDVNMAGFTLFYNNDSEYVTYDLADDLVAATTTLGNNWTSMDDLTLDNFASWPNKIEKVYGFELNAFPSSLFWINDENNAVNGETSFGIHKITIAESSSGVEHTLWTGLSGSESYMYCYYGTITPTGIITPWDDCPDEATKTFYKDYTTSAVGTWIDPFNVGDYNVYPVNNYLSGGVSASFTVGNSGSQTNVDYVDVGNTNNYYINFTNHSTQDATFTLFKAANKSLLSGYYDNYPIPSGKTVSFLLNKSSMGGDGNYVDFSFMFKLDNVYNSDGTTQTDFYQATGIGTWNSTDDLKAIGRPAGESANYGYTLYESSTWGYNIDISNRFMVDIGILEEVSTSGNRTAHVDFVYDYWFENAGITDWSQTGLRLYAEKYTNYRHVLQEKTTDGTLAIGGVIANSNASLAMADLVQTYTSASDTFNYPAASPNRPWAFIGSSCVPQWNENSNDEWSSLVNIGSAYFRFCGVPFKGSATSSDPGTITFNNMVWRDYEDDDATFSGTINVYSFDKTQLRNYVRNLGGLGANWAPMRTRFNDAQWNAYEIALKTAKEVLANQKTNQKAVTDAYNEIYRTTEALKATSSLTSQVAEVTYTKRAGDYDSAVVGTWRKYIIMPIGTETTVPAYNSLRWTVSAPVVAKQSSNLKTNYTQYDTGINPIDYRYWKIDFTGVDEALTKATGILNTSLEDYSGEYYEKIKDARDALSAFDRDADTWTPTHQSDIDTALANLKDLLAHDSTEPTNHQFIEDDKGNYTILFDETNHWYECEVCGYKFMHEEHTLDKNQSVDNENEHIVECTYVDASSGNTCDYEFVEPHSFTNPVLVRPTLVDGIWTDGTYTYTCICGAEKEEDAVRADYSEFEDAVAALEALNENENLTDDAKAEIAEALAKADNLADDLVTAEQDQIDKLVKELQDVKADVEKAISEVVGSNPITKASSGIKVQFLKETGVDKVEYVQLDANDTFESVRMRLINGNKDLPITVTSVAADKAAIGFTDAFTLDENGGSNDLVISDTDAFNKAGIITYTIKYTINGLMNADGNPVVFTTKAYLYVKGEKFTPYHLMDEDCTNGPATAEWAYTLESAIGDFAPVYNNKAPRADFGNSNLKREKALAFAVYNYYDYEDNKCFAECTGTGDEPYIKGDAHASTYRFYIDTSLAPTWQEAEFKAKFAETAESVYDNATFKYIRLANNAPYYEKISETDKTFTVTLVPGASSNVPAKTWTTSSNGDLSVTHYDNPNQDDYIFGNYLDEAQDIYTAYSKFSGYIPQKTEEAKMMFSHRFEYNMAATGILSGKQAEAVTMTTHLYITSYDKAELREAVANAEQAGYNSEYFDAEKYEAYEDALENAKEVLGKAETNQDEIDAATTALNNAIADLENAENETKFVLTVTHSIHENADKNSEATGAEYDYYLVNGDVTPTLKASIIALDTINKYDAAKTLNVTADAEHTYNYWYIDYSGVKGAIDAADEIINDTTTGYSDEYKTSVETVRDALQDILDGKEETTTPESQSTVDGAIKAVTELTGHTHDYADETCTEAKTCKICGAKDGEANGHTWGAPVLTKKPTADEQGEYTETCEICGVTQITKVDLADYDEFNTVVGQLEALLNTENLTDEAKQTIENALDKAEALDKKLPDDATTVDGEFIEGGQDTIDALVNELKGVVTNTNNAITDGSALKPDYEAWEEAEDAYDALDTTNVKTEIIAEAEGLKGTIADKQANKILTQATATQDDIDEATRRLNEIINGIRDGSYKNPADFTEVDKDLADAKDKAAKNDVVDGVKEEIQEIENALNDLRDNATADDQPTINVLEKELEEIIKGINDGTLVKPDSTAAEEAVNNAEALAGKIEMPQSDKNKIDELRTELNGILDEISNDEPPTAKEYQDRLDAVENAANEILEKYKDCTDGHAWNDGELTRPVQNDDGTWVDGTYTYTCENNCGTTKTEPAVRADYEAYDQAVAGLNNLLANDKFTQATRDKITAALKANVIADNLVEAEQPIVNAAADALKLVLDEINAGIADGSALKPDFTGYEESRNTYEDLVNRYGDKIKDSVEKNVADLDAIVDGVREDKTATKADDQDIVDDAKTDLDKIIDGIIDGSLRDPDYTEVDEDLADAKEKAEGNDDVNDGVKERIEEIKQTIENLKKDPETDANDQPEIDKLEEELEKIIEDIEKGVYDKPDFSGYDESHDTYEELANEYGDRIKDEAVTEVNGLDTTVENIRNDKTATRDDDQDDVNAAEGRLEEIIAGIKDGSLLDPDYSGAENAIENAEDIPNLSDEDRQKIEDLKEDLQEIKEKKEPEANAKDDQDDVDAIKDAAQAIINKYADCEDGNHTDIEPKDHNCDICGTELSKCADNNKDHNCDICGTKLSECADNDNDHNCDICGTELSKCADNDKDHNCDICGTELSECADNNNDHNCDICGTELSKCADNDKDHNCDTCGTKLSECADDDKDHNCDICGTELSKCADNDKDHNCDTCGTKLSECADNDKDHNCDICGTKLSECADNDKDHNCDICDAELSECADNDKDHNCDTCGTELSKCADNNNDHNCDTCGTKLSECTDASNDNDHKCDICGAEDITSHNYVNPVLTRPTKNEDGTWNNGTYTSTCNCGATSTTEAERANYEAYDEAVAGLNELLKDATLTAAAIAEINKVLADNKIADNLVTAEQDTVDNAADALKVVLDKITGENVNNYKKPDFSNWNAAEGTYDALDKTNVKDEILAEVTNLKKEINALKNDPTANKAEDQKTINDATARLNEIIAGINDGSLLKPDGTECNHIGTAKAYITNVADDNKLNTHSVKCLACEEIIETEACSFTTETVEATCHTEGYLIYSCTVCEYGFMADFSGTIPHYFSEWRTNVGNCKEVNTQTRYCVNSGCLLQETVPVVGEDGKPVYGAHTLVIVPGVDVTCTKDGYSDYTRCIVCNTVAESETIPAKGHVDDNGNGNCDTCRQPMNPNGHCSCFCHGDSFFEKLLFRFVNFFWKLFKINANCECGVKHW